MDNKLLTGEGNTEDLPEEAALLMRLRIFVNMRWLAILGIIIATLVASQIFHISFPTPPVYIICVFMALYNLGLLWQLRKLKPEKTGSVIHRARTYSNTHILLDLLALIVLLHFTGGIENPFIFYFVFHVILASIALHYKTVYLLATSAILMVTLLVGLEYARMIPHVNLVGFVAPERYKEVGYIVAILASLATILYGSAYMATAISGELRKRQRQVVRLREDLLHEKTKELEDSSREIAKLEEEKNRFLRFLGIAAHDLKAPLAAIQSYIGVMLGGFSGELNEKQKNMLERSGYRITELLSLISDLLDIPRIETGLIVQEMEEISLRQIIRDCLQEQRSLAKEKGVKLKVELAETLPKIRGSSTRLRQVITNLVNNAVNYTPEGMVTIRVTEVNNAIQFEVMDTGIGIPVEDSPRIFDDFFRASNVEIKGTGLGLSIAKRIVEAHGGRIWVESPCPGSGTGSKFTFTLPKKSKRRQQ
ncbi:sensor histidine kinase [Chloroflexota bacterium]